MRRMFPRIGAFLRIEGIEAKKSALVEEAMPFFIDSVKWSHGSQDSEPRKFSDGEKTELSNLGKDTDTVRSEGTEASESSGGYSTV